MRMSYHPVKVFSNVWAVLFMQSYEDGSYNPGALPHRDEIKIDRSEPESPLEIKTDKRTFSPLDIVTITVTNNGDEPLEFPNSVLGLQIKNLDIDAVYPLFSAQVITTLQPGGSKTFEFTYEELVNEIGTGTIEATGDGGDAFLASTTFTLDPRSSD
jgi:hypothetical protein